MKVERKQWDSDFFHLEIGYVEIKSLEESRGLAEMCEQLREDYDLIYVFDVNRIGFEAEGASLVDEKILYSKLCEDRKKYDEVMMYVPSQPNESLYKLAIVSGGYSRFKLDEHLPSGTYEKLYHRWIENACPSDESNKQIFVHFVDGIERGMITIDYHEDHATIGLVAVNPKFQHQGVGTKIMSTLEYWLRRKNVKTIDVITQAANQDACHWYEKNGFTIQTVTHIYHWWLRK